MRENLKDLEAYILGVIGQYQPCTPYRAMKFFLESPSIYYSGSAGAIYPAIERMEKRGLIKSVASGTKGKKSKMLSLTAKGKKQFKAWYEAPDLISDGGFDPLRGRVSLVGVFKKANQNKQLEKLYHAAKDRLAQMDEIESHFEESHPLRLSVEVERATLRAKVDFLSQKLKK